jgi:Uma2 family endonuclease
VRAPETESGPIGPMTWEEFLAFEQAATRKHEYVGGFAWPWGDVELPVGLAGATRRHNTIAVNIMGELWNTARRTPSLGCRVFGSDMLLRVGGVSYYPDVQLVCDPSDQHERYTERPCVVIEVLSDSTARTDYGEKLLAYQSIPTLQAYLIVSQKERRVVRHWRSGELGPWLREDVIDGAVALPCLGVDLVLEAIYSGVD